MSDGTIAPPHFNGTATKGAGDWYGNFNSCCQYKVYDNAKIFAILKVVFKRTAALWLKCCSRPRDWRI